MARKSRKSGVQEIIKSLVDSEIPEIQAVAKQLNEWTKQLEEHSWKLQHYASEIESVAASEASDASRDEVSLAELVKDLETTLAQLRGGGPPRPAALPEGRKAPVVERRIEEEPKAIKPVPREPVEKEEPGPAHQIYETYTTPEGFVVRRVRH
jgi:hypothetical protein